MTYLTWFMRQFRGCLEMPNMAFDPFLVKASIGQQPFASGVLHVGKSNNFRKQQQMNTFSAIVVKLIYIVFTLTCKKLCVYDI